MSGRHRRQALSLLEVIVVLAIVGVLFGLLLAAVQAIRARAIRASCADHLRQIGLALHHYHDAHATLPPGCSYRDGKDPYPFLAWTARLLPYLEQPALWDETVRAFAQDKYFVNDPPHTAQRTALPVFLCPADGRTHIEGVEEGKKRVVAMLAYLGVEGTDRIERDGVLFLDSAVRLTDVRDGTSNTLAAGERPPSARKNFGWWYAGEGQQKDGSGDMTLGVRETYYPISQQVGDCSYGPYNFVPGRLDNQCDLFHFWSLHSGGAHFLFCDGSVRFLAYAADAVLPALATRAGDESVSAADW
jgi:prepilin-type processing-associated H-X9-DG protein/prepilin-type N-terminal cleavage/methylation domain-containing protein